MWFQLRLKRTQAAFQKFQIFRRYLVLPIGQERVGWEHLYFFFQPCCKRQLLIRYLISQPFLSESYEHLPRAVIQSPFIYTSKLELNPTPSGFRRPTWMQIKFLRLHRFWKSPRTRSFIRRLCSGLLILQKFDNPGIQYFKWTTRLNQVDKETRRGDRNTATKTFTAFLCRFWIPFWQISGLYSHSYWPQTYVPLFRRPCRIIMIATKTLIKRSRIVDRNFLNVLRRV